LKYSFKNNQVHYVNTFLQLLYANDKNLASIIARDRISPIIKNDLFSKDNEKKIRQKIYNFLTDRNILLFLTLHLKSLFNNIDIKSPSYSVSLDLWKKVQEVYKDKTSPCYLNEKNRLTRSHFLKEVDTLEGATIFTPTPTLTACLMAQIGIGSFVE